MATRQVVTSQPDIACDVCERRLLRGERPEVFLAGAERRTVCELCTPRAAHEGWLRAVDGDVASPRTARGRRGRTLLDRLRGRREPAARALRAAAAPPESSAEEYPEPFEFPDEAPLSSPSVGASFLAESFAEDRAEALDDPRPPDAATDAHADSRGEIDHAVDRHPATTTAIEAFNASDGPRRIAGVARALGAPEVSVRHSGSPGERFLILVAWELCWYRYEVDLDRVPAGVNVVEQGTELDELSAQDRAQNATADERGELALAA